MAIFAISDLHLSSVNPKPMDIFGPQWEDHAERIAANWDNTVGADDIVLMPGDHSWAMRLDDALPDLQYITERPGRKVLIRGNHDYWWNRQATSKIQRLIDPSITLLQGSSVVIDDTGIAGTRGWRLEDHETDQETGNDAKIFTRELSYLERALEAIPSDVSTKIAMLHYPPFSTDGSTNEFADLLEKHKVDILVYGHIHQGTGMLLEGPVNGTIYYLVAVDHIGFTPRLIHP